MKKIILALLVVILITPFLKAQNEKYGSDSAKCVINLSLYKEFVNQQNYKDAINGWRNAYKICPKSTKQLYKDGEKIYKYFIDKEKNVDIKNKYVDTLMQVYDKRVEIYNDGDDVRGRQGFALYKYRETAYEDAYNKMLFSLNANNFSIAYVQSFMFTTVAMFKDNKIDAGAVVENFSKISAVIEKEITEEADTSKKRTYNSIKDNVSSSFAKSGAASCDVLVNYYTPKYNETPTNADLLKTITKFLDMNNCTDSKLFFDASESLYSIEPSGPAAYNIAILAVKSSNYQKAEQYYKKSIELTEDKALKAKYYLDLAKIDYSQKQFANARTNALNAANLKSGWGDPYILIAKAYAASAQSCGEKPFEKNAVYWVVVDKLNKAKAIDASVANEANNLISQYRAYFPSKEEAFFENVTEGASYTVGCWINETTTATFTK